MEYSVKILNKNNTDKRASKIIGAVIYSVIIAVLLVIVAYSIAVKVLNITPMFSYYTILSNSMNPTASKGDMVFVINTDFNSLQQGDIITFLTDINLDGNKETVTHYFADYNTIDGKTYIQTHRENSAALDSWLISPEELIGKTVLILPKMGKYSEFLRSPIGFAALALDILFVIAAVMFIEMLDEDKYAVMLKTPLTE